MKKQRLLHSAAVAASVGLLAACGAHGNMASTIAPRPDRSLALVLAGRDVVYVAGLGNAVVYYPAGLHANDPNPLGAISDGVTRASGVWVDGDGTLYVVNDTTPATLAEYRRGRIRPFKIISDGLYEPNCVAVDSAGTAYVDDAKDQGVILVYPKGASRPSHTVSIPKKSSHQGAGCMAFAKNGDLLFATFDVETNATLAFAMSTKTLRFRELGLLGLPGNALGTDAAGDIYVGGEAGDIAVYAPGSKTPARTIDAGESGFYSDFAVTADGTIYWPRFDGSGIYEFAPGASSPTNVIEGGGVDAAVGER